jgi:hypothetical protein
MVVTSHGLQNAVKVAITNRHPQTDPNDGTNPSAGRSFATTCHCRLLLFFVLGYTSDGCHLSSRKGFENTFCLALRASASLQAHGEATTI